MYDMLHYALNEFYGIKEIVGDRHNPIIVNLFKSKHIFGGKFGELQKSLP